MASVELSQGKVAQVDDADLVKTQGRKWFAVKWGGKFYAVCQEGTKEVGLHRYLMGAGRGQTVGFSNGDTLDCRRSNLIQGSRASNLPRRPSASSVTGVTFRPDVGLWEGRVGFRGRRYSAGHYLTLDDARIARERLSELLKLKFRT